MNMLVFMADPIAKVGGYIIAGVGYLIVFSALILLVLIFASLPNIFQYFANKKIARSGKKISEATAKVTSTGGMDANVNAAIALALHLYFNEMHDKESNIITIRNATKQYSPWSSKIYGVMNQPKLKH